jgi:N-acetyl-anhydromuramyl-L-alanine amidase AmpD
LKYGILEQMNSKKIIFIFILLLIGLGIYILLKKDVKVSNYSAENVGNTDSIQTEIKPNLQVIPKLNEGWGYVTPETVRPIENIIIHSSFDALGTDPYSVDGVIAEYKSYDVSPHYLISRDGIVYQLVDENYLAQHAGGGKLPDGSEKVNTTSIGIEMIYKDTESPNELQYAALKEMVRYLKSKYPIKNVLEHSTTDKYGKTDPWNFEMNKIQ